jgi:hypothetical protein
MDTQITKIEVGQLEEVVKNSGLAIQEGEEIKQSYQPYLVQLAEIQGQAGKINFETPTSTDEMIARDLRLKTVKIRTSASDLKDTRKRTYLLRGNLEQAAYNLIAASRKLTEDVFNNVEKAREIAEAKRQSELKTIRDAEVLPVAEFIPFGLDLGKMTEEDYQKLLSGAKMQFKAKQDAETKAEEERRQAELARLAEEKRIRDENERLKKEAEEKERQLEEERKEAERRQFEINEAFRIEREKAEKEKKEAEEKARIEKEEADKILKAEQEEKARLLAEIERKRIAEEKARKEAEEKEKDEQKKRELAEKKAAAAPDKQKLIALAVQIDAILLPQMSSPEGIAIIASTKVLLEKTAIYVRDQANKL